MTKIVLRWILAKTFRLTYETITSCILGYEHFTFRISRKFIGSCSMDVNQSLKYFKKTFSMKIVDLQLLKMVEVIV